MSFIDDFIKDLLPIKTRIDVTESSTSGGSIDLSGYAKKTDIPAIPKKVSELENDAGYLTEHQSLTAYAKKSTVDKLSKSVNANSKEQSDIAAAFPAIELVDNVDKMTDHSVIYLIKDDNGYGVYIYTYDYSSGDAEIKFTRSGTVAVDLSQCDKFNAIIALMWALNDPRSIN